MTAFTSHDAAANGGETVGSITDPATLTDHEDVDAEERTYTHPDPDHCEAGIDGRAVLGVTDADGALLLWVHESEDRAILPNVPVETGGDWARTAREYLTETADLPVDLDAVERVREVDHVVERDGEQTHLGTTHHVVFAGSPATDGGDVTDLAADTLNEDWTAGWYADVPVDLEADDAGVLADVRLFAG